MVTSLAKSVNFFLTAIKPVHQSCFRASLAVNWSGRVREVMQLAFKGGIDARTPQTQQSMLAYLLEEAKHPASSMRCDSDVSGEKLCRSMHTICSNI